MTSDRKQAANRANASRSTGPRTAAGKARSSRNALRHGLNLPITASETDDAIAALTHLLSKDAPGNPDAARRAAEAQLHLQRIRRMRTSILQTNLKAYEESLGADAGALQIADRVGICLVNAADELRTLDGYERKALSRRKKAIRALID